MIEVGAFEAENKLGSLLDRVKAGEEIVITRHGKAVARLVPHKPGVDSERAKVAMRRMRARAAALKAGAFHWQEWKSWRDEGRP
ncbi:MAG TPA: type II toxin-antitoxin system prevent-host-death family antitoxin [Bryobacteraceae bacterium]|nr:type II toxin-antitoxin system prevent-host-death family antitoxin [Bryobacteraceae bacterium]